MNEYMRITSAVHSLLRYFVLIPALIVSSRSLIALLKGLPFTNGHRKMVLAGMLCCDVQLLAGLAVYYFFGHLNMIALGEATKTYANRFYTIEHPIAMVVGIICMHAANGIAKRNGDSRKKHLGVFWTSFIALFIFMAMTPWPHRMQVGRPFFPQFTAIG